MLYPKLPQQKAGYDKQASRQRQQAVPRLSPVQQKEKRIVLDQRIGNHEGTYLQDSFAVNGDRVLSILPCAVRKHIHKFQPFYGKEADGGIDEEESAEDDGAANQHKKYRHNFGRRPAYAAYRKSVDEHDDSLQDASNPGKFNAAAQHQ